MKMSLPNVVILSIEGNIGSGKSTVLAKLKETFQDIVFVDEPVEDWLRLKNDDGESLLEVFYKDKKRWSYTFQNAAVLYRYRKLREALEKTDKNTPKILIMERSLETDRSVFCRMLNKDGFIDNLEKNLYEEWYSHLKSMLPSIDAYVYIKTGPEICLDRIARRAREGESIIPLDYLKELDKYHGEWLFGSEMNHPVFVFDNSTSFPNIHTIHEYATALLNTKISANQ